MPVYDFTCDDCGGRFETLLPAASTPDPDCPQCGSRLRRRIATGVALLGRARTPSPASAAPKSWLGTHRGDPEFVTTWRRTLEERAKLEERHPELAQPQPVVLAHEGPYHDKPLTRDGIAGPLTHPHGHTHSHGATHSHGHTHSQPGTATGAQGSPDVTHKIATDRGDPSALHIILVTLRHGTRHGRHGTHRCGESSRRCEASARRACGAPTRPAKRNSRQSRT